MHHPVAAVLLLAASLGAFAAEWTGKVVGIADGDTLTVLRDRQRVKVRLTEIDAPEKAQAFGARSKQSLSQLAFGKQVRVVDAGPDRYGRTLGRVYAGGVDVNREQVRRGMAWAYREYITDQAVLLDEQSARDRRAGLWADARPLPPWQYRHRKSKHQ